MKWLKEENGKLVSPPTYDKKSGLFNCHFNRSWLTNNGYTQWTDEEIEAWYASQDSSSDVDKSPFEIACSHFKEVCNEIATLTNKSEFKGTHDEVFEFYNSASYQTNKGMRLAIALNACREICEYEALNIGLGITEWLDVCWSK